MEDSRLPNPLMEKPAGFHDMTRETWEGRCLSSTYGKGHDVIFEVNGPACASLTK